MLQLTTTANTLLVVFVIAFCGYILGSVQIKGIQLGSAGIFLVGLLFGHYGVVLPAELQTIGLVMFITAVGFSSGKGFFSRMRRNGVQYILICLTTSVVGGVLCFCCIRIAGLDAPLAVGIMTGAFTTSPGFAAAKEIAGSQAARVAAGYGIVYPLGVICKVLLIQLIPRVLCADMETERNLILSANKHSQNCEGEKASSFKIDSLGLCAFSLAAGLGILLGSIATPLPGGGKFSLGSTGGPLIISLCLGAMGRIGPVDVTVNSSTITALKEIGLLLFFSCAGVEGGHGIADIYAVYGLSPLFYGLILICIPFMVGFLLFRFVLRLPLLNGLGSLTASMTCTPSLAALTNIAKTDAVAVAYATTYPFALVMLIIVVQLLMKQ